MKKTLLSSLFVVAILSISAPLLTTQNAQAKTVVDDFGNTIEISDKYFNNPPSESDKKALTEQYQELQVAINNPNQQMGDLAMKYFQNYRTVQSYVDMTYNLNPATFQSKKPIMTLIIGEIGSLSNFIDKNSNGGLETDNLNIKSDDYGAILKPTDLTVYNATEKQGVKQALQTTFNAWDSPKIHFRFVNSPDDARIVVRAVDSKNGNFEGSFDGSMTEVSVYSTVLIQANVNISPELSQLPGDDPTLVHTLEHEFGHVFGLTDIL
ncbi:hypothetical protein [Companilactobacillus mishanensis]|uniref:hypothetical protein n=1 Tax=Companilactobacillus mishanensis TaxID=2486008 RepID=UPI00129611AF|nr:hypothetical protein [Companilactobacillus mishanensis]MQS89830.1 hypothetical protein [Companilactobacillus mishanensis]